MSFKLICVGGARPNFMKLAPLVRELRTDPVLSVILVHTGQHYDEKMSGSFFRELAIPVPDHHLEVGSGSHAQQTAAIMQRIEPVMLSERPDAVVVVGDVNSTLAAALVAAKLGIKVIHVEAGLRSFDRTMPEEINRVATDAISDLFLVTEESGLGNLIREGAREDAIAVVGNLMIDSLRANLHRAQRESGIRSRLGLSGAYGLVTLHRPANVDNAGQLAGILAALQAISRDVPLVFPVHPRTQSRLESMGLTTGERITLIEPLGYLDFLQLMSGANMVLTDSGGIQEETTALGIPCLTLRDNTERPITVEQGTNTLAGTSLDSILAAWRTAQAHPKAGRVPPLWDGHAAGRCRQAIRRFLSLP